MRREAGQDLRAAPREHCPVASQGPVVSAASSFLLTPRLTPPPPTQKVPGSRPGRNHFKHFSWFPQKPVSYGKNSLRESGTGSKLYSVVRGKSPCHYFCQPCRTDKNSALWVPGYFSSWQLCRLQRPCVNPALHSKTQLCKAGT